MAIINTHYYLYVFYKYVRTPILLMLILLSVMVCCRKNQVNKEKIELRKEELLVVHDNLMVELGELRSIIHTLQKYAADSTLDIGYTTSCLKPINNLQRADEAMWDWMHHFNISYQHNNDSVTLAYFDEQYRLMLEIQELFDSAIYVGNKVVSNYERVQ